MSVIDKIALDQIKIFANLRDVALGGLIFLGGDTQAVGLRCVYVPSVGPSQLGFLPLEGPNKYIFLDPPAHVTTPALDVSHLAYIAMEGIDIEKIHAPRSPGDLCVLQGREELCIAVARLADQNTVAGYLMLQGSHTGEVVTGYLPQLRLSKAIVLAHQPASP